jgi:hypothetical protein
MRCFCCIILFFLLSLSTSAEVQFVDATAAAGIIFRHVDGRTGEKYLLETLGSGAVFFDFDVDGALDLYVVNATHIPPPVPEKTPQTHAPRNRLYRNNGNGTFTDVTASAGVDDPGWSSSACFLDYNSDGHLDLFVVNYLVYSLDVPYLPCGEDGIHTYCHPSLFEGAPDRLYRNNGDGTFTDVSQAAGVGGIGGLFHGKGLGVVSADFNNDGAPDLYVANDDTRNDFFYNNGDGTFSEISLLAGCAYSFNGVAQAGMGVTVGDYNNDSWIDIFVTNLSYETNALYRNNGDGTFTDVTTRAGVHNTGKGLGVLFTDYNNDGYPDIFVANDAVPDFLYQNNKDGTFTDVAISAGVAYNSEGRATASMGIASGDYDNDGIQDLFVTNFSLEINSLFRNGNDGFYTMTTFEVGLADPSFSKLGFGTQFLDADNDGTLELFVANGHVWDNVSQITPSLSYRQHCQIFGNTGTGQFRDLSETAGRFFKRSIVARGVAVGDYNNDGATDILVTCCGEPPILLRNDSQVDDWVKIRLIGTQGNRDGIGAKVWIHTDEMTLFREVTCGGSYASGSEQTLLFGIGAQKTLQSIEIKWQSGHTQTLDFLNTGSPVNQVVRIVENR